MNATQCTPKLDELLCFHTYAVDRSFAKFYASLFEGTGMTFPKWVVLLALEENGAMPIGGLSQVIGVESNTLSPMLKKMAECGSVSRERSLEDERRVLINLTDSGREIIREYRKKSVARWNSLGIDEGKVAEAIQLLKSVKKCVDECGN